MIATVLERLQKVRQTAPQAWVACCPAHDDKSPSMTLRETPDGMVLMHCFGGCEVQDILGAIGLTFDDLFPEKPKTHHRGFRRPFPAADVLETTATEALIVLMAARAMQRGEILTPDRVDRVSVAAGRIEEARRLARG